jgi:hypothetical protein
MTWYERNKEKIAQRRREKIAADPEYLVRESRRKAELRKKNGRSPRSPNEIIRDRTKKKPLKQGLCAHARARARKAGIDALIRTVDLNWPTHCPVLDIELDYTTPRGQRYHRAPDRPSLDRWDNTKGYTVENTRVISLRANLLKNDATWQELMAVAIYARDGIKK